jgi:hypothetical protein
MAKGACESVERLPQQLLVRASIRGQEYAWSPSDIPEVIEAARKAGFVNVGGQLQFRIPDGGTCECYWVDVDTYKSVPTDLAWAERVAKTADSALAEFMRLSAAYDFLQEGRKSFDGHLQKLVERGVDPRETICFVWYVLDQEEAMILENPTSTQTNGGNHAS